MQKFLIPFVFLTALTQIGSGLKCWECSELLEDGESCKDPFMNSTSTCLLDSVCFKQVTRKVSVGDVEVPSLVSRGCGNHCDELIKETSAHCSTCDTDLCNSSGIAVPSLATVVVLLVTKFFHL